MSTTKNFGLIKPELTDAADITTYNPNWDIVDAELNDLSVNTYRKNEVCADGTLLLFGASQPDDIFTMFGNHWWKRRVVETGETIVEELKVERYEFTTKGDTNTSMGTLYYAKSYTLTKDGYELINPVEFNLTYTSGYSAEETFKGNYYMVGTTKGNIMYYCGTTDGSTNFNVSATYNSSTEVYIVTFKGVTTRTYQVKMYDTVGDWEFVSSPSANTYPTGQSGMFYYEYLGIPFANAREGVKIETGSYVGTGTIGQSNPNTLTFDGKPIVVFVQANSDTPTANGRANTLIAANPFKYGYSEYTATDSSSNDRAWLHHLFWVDNSLSWYFNSTNSSNSEYQLNESGVTYKYTAIIQGGIV